ncbi:Type I restriction enzyme EcoKI specificity protein [Serratia marcescens]|uniref:restriction endonuclease subunit S n=1 Tax=Serratia TaxID=613 RepID=UPI0007451E65|nr:MULTISPECIES: restriction endonuclease subunit S [Serratia]EIY8599249.1 restriction endonuclease subunit S [Serratia marcescens]EIY8854184.1 restriction endonuclease subunit S [Serratia marcescens]EIY8864197.1 restriction endonuclease subunit S [Serratia marcescens]EIY9013697.1 restriction endonuclease subunit S [Serratia marcescens]MBH3161843.1 restriction endonuclease subunit S [Serratia marcescens]
MTKYKAYPEYKTTGLGWLTEIPDHWEVKKLKYLGQAIIGLTYSPDDVVDEGEGTLVLRSSNVQNGKLEFLDNVYVRKSIPLHLKVKDGDILICARNGSRALIGKNAKITKDAEGMTFGAFMSIFRGSYNNYLSHVFASALFEYQSGSFLTATINQLTTSNLNSFEIPLPPQTEQDRIVNFLDHETAKIDNLIEKQRQLIELLKEKSQAVISYAVTKGLNPEMPMKDSGVKWLGKVPEHWSIIKLKHLIDSFEQGWSPQCEARLAEKNEYGVLKVGCVNSGKFNSLEHKALPSNLEPQKKYLLKKNDLLISRANTKELVGSSAVVDKNYDNLILCDKLYRIKLISSVNPCFISEYIRTPFVRKQIELSASGASHSMQNIGQDTIKELFVALPPENEVQLLIDFIEKEANVFNTLTDLSHHQVALLQERRTALISAAVTGKIDVRDWVAPDMQDAEEPQETTA